MKRSRFTVEQIAVHAQEDKEAARRNSVKVIGKLWRNILKKQSK